MTPMKKIRQSTPLDDLIGKIVKSIGITAEKTHLVFTLDDDTTVAFSAEGDCCSHSWIEHINGVDVLLGRVINDAVNRELPPPAEHDPASDIEECIQQYGWALKTQDGHFDIEMRNQSNGYYGGWLERYKHVVKDELIPVTEDF